LKIGFSVNTDWSEAAGQTQDGAAQSAVKPAASGFANSQSYLDLSSATFGTLRLGNPNSETFTAASSVAQPAFSTGVGSSYGTAFSIHNGIGTGTTSSANIFANSSVTASSDAAGAGTNAGQRQVRQANTIKYISPNISGFSAVLATVRKNDTGSASTAATGTADIVGVNEVAVSYVNGPATVVYSTTKVSVGAAALANALTPNTSSTMSILAASYQVLPQLKLHAGLGKATSTGFATSAAYDTSSYSFGVTYNVTPVIVVMAQMAKVNDKAASNTDRKMTGLGADYNFSKTARAYVRYDNIDYASNLVAFNGTKQTRTAVGVSKSF